MVPPVARVYLPALFPRPAGRETVAEALTTWALMDTRQHALLKVTDFYGEFPTDAPLEPERLPDKDAAVAHSADAGSR